MQAWRDSGRVVQVGVQRTSDGRFRAAHEFLRAGGIGKVVQAQTEYYRNSSGGQWRSAGLSRDMTPGTIDWEMFLGTRFGLAPKMPFDRARFAQWRCYWPFGTRAVRRAVRGPADADAGRPRACASRGG